MSGFTASNIAAGFDDKDDSDSDDIDIGIKVSTSANPGPSHHVAPSSSSSSSAPPVPQSAVASAKEARLAALRDKINAGRAANTKAVLDEKQKLSEGTKEYYKKMQDQSDLLKKKKLKEEAQDLVQEGKLDKAKDVLKSVLKAQKRAMAPKGKEHLGESLDFVETFGGKKKKRKLEDGEADSMNFAYDMYNQDASFRAHEKRTANTEFQAKDYQIQLREVGEETFYSSETQTAVTGFKDTAEGKARFMKAFQDAEEKKKNFSRRRTHMEEEDFRHINERNRQFNKKMDRAFNEHTLEIRQNLERGTAL